MTKTTSFEWLPARLSDAQDMLRIYCESLAAGGGSSPVFKEPSIVNLRWLINMCKNHGLPIWQMRVEGEMVGWCLVRTMAWGPEVCARTGDFSIYVARRWQGRGVVARMLLNTHKELPRYGFDALTLWIFSHNRKSLNVAHAYRFKKWGHLPAVANFGGLTCDVEIWGISLDDPQWGDYMRRLDERHARRDAYLAQRDAPPPQAGLTADTAATSG